jgi:hypothetical protein
MKFGDFAAAEFAFCRVWCCFNFVSVSSAVDGFLLVLSCLFVRCVSFRVSQDGNKTISVAVACQLVACILHNPKLATLYLDHAPSACIAHAAWRSEVLPVPTAEVAGTGWTEVLAFLREVRECKMLFKVPPVVIGPAVLCCLFYICPLPFQAARNKYERLMAAAPAATLDCNALWDHHLLLSAVSNAAAKHAGSPL